MTNEIGQRDRDDNECCSDLDNVSRFVLSQSKGRQKV